MKIYLNLLQQQEKNWNLISSFLSPWQQPFHGAVKNPTDEEQKKRKRQSS